MSSNPTPQIAAVLSTGEESTAPLEMQMSTKAESPAVMTNPSSSAPMDTEADSPLATNKAEQPAECQSDSQTLAAQSVCTNSAAPVEEAERMQVSVSEEQAQPVHPASEEEQHGREATPEELANLGKAVDMVQARSCQLSPSLLTVGQTPPDMDSPARHAFERGRHVVVFFALLLAFSLLKTVVVL